MLVSTSDHGEMGMRTAAWCRRCSMPMRNRFVSHGLVEPALFQRRADQRCTGVTGDFLPPWPVCMAPVMNSMRATTSAVSTTPQSCVEHHGIHRFRSMISKFSRRALHLRRHLCRPEPSHLSPRGLGSRFAARPNRLQAVRTKDFKYVRYFSGDAAYEPANWQGELYDLRPDGGDYYPDVDP